MKRFNRWQPMVLAISILLACFYPGLLNAQETQISQHAVVLGAVGNMAISTDTPTSGVYSTSLTIGQPFVGESTGNNFSTNLGIWSFYLKEPDAPLVHASDGEAAHPSYISVGWSQDVLSPNATGEPPVTSSFPEDKWAVSRDSVFRANVPMADPFYLDLTDYGIYPGTLYSYGIKVVNQFGVSDEGFDIGFTMPNGKITGRVFTPGPTPGAPWTPTGNPVADVEVSLSPINGKSVSFDGADDFVKIDSWYEDDIDSTFSVEFWFNVDLTPANATIFDMGNRFRVRHTDSQLEVHLGDDS